MRGAATRRVDWRWVRLGLGLLLAAGCAVAVAAGAQSASNSDVVQVRTGGDWAQVRVVVDLERPATSKVEDVGGPGDHLALLLQDAAASGVMHGQGRGLLRGWTIADAPGGARLTVDLAAPARLARRFLLPPADGVATYRYVIDLAAASRAARPAQIAAAAPQAQPPANPPRLRKVIVLDPGHGGRDPGAHGALAFEKTVTLATAIAVRARLEATGRYQVILTRATDAYVPLEERVQIARRAGADLFLSLHADSGPEPSIHGASVYTLSEKGQERVGYVLGPQEWFLQDAAATDDRAVGRILLDLTQRTTRNRSAAFAQTLIEHVGDRAPLLPRSQRDAGYFVLLAPDVPAALLEMGFITNPDDEARLREPVQREALAQKIAESIDAYFMSRTRLAAR